MKLIFLDIDGVLNSHNSAKEYIEEHGAREALPHHLQWKLEEPAYYHINQLNKITDYTHAKIVISSTWRPEFSTIGWNRYFAALGIHGEVYDTTPKLDTYRGTEIACWLMKHYDRHWKGDTHELVDSFIVIDDDYDCVYDFIQNRWLFVKTETGLESFYVDKAIAMLNAPFDYSKDFNVKGNGSYAYL